MRKRECNENDTAYCKLAHALSSSGRFQSRSSIFSDNNSVSATDLSRMGAATILISPLFTRNSTLSLRPLSLISGLGMRIPREFPIGISVVIIVITLYIPRMILSRDCFFIELLQNFNSGICGSGYLPVLIPKLVLREFFCLSNCLEFCLVPEKNALF